MKEIRIIILFFLFFYAKNSFAENNIMFEKANQLYHNKLYDSAAKLYSQMIQDGYCDADLYYNAGNAFYRSNKIGEAIWYYKKALQIDVNKNYTDNLKLAQRRIKNPIRPAEEIFFMRWWQNAYNLMSVNKWAITSLVLFLVTIILLGIKNIRKKNIVSKSFTNILILLTCFSLFFLGVKYYQDTYHYHGIIIKPDTKFRENAKSPAVTLSDGIEVKFISRKNNMLTVELPDGRVGEIQESAFRKL